MKRQYTIQENIFASDAINKELISQIYKELTAAGYKKNKQTVKDEQKTKGDFFSKIDIQMAKRHMKRYSISLIIGEMQVQTTMRYHLTPIRKAIIIMFINNKCWRGFGEKRTHLGC